MARVCTSWIRAHQHAAWADVWLGLRVGSRHRAGERDGARDHSRGLAHGEFIRRATTDLRTAYRACVEKYRWIASRTAVGDLRRSETAPH